MSVDKVSTTCRGIRALLRPRKRSISSHFETCGPIAHVGVPSPSLAPGLTTGRAMGAEVAAAAPAPVGTPGGGATVRVGVDRARAASGKGDHGWRRPGRLGTRIGSQLTGRVQRLVEQAGARLEVFGTSTSRPRGLKGCMRHTGGVVAQPDMEQQADQDESDQEAWVHQRMGCHGGVPFSPA